MPNENDRAIEIVYAFVIRDGQGVENLVGANYHGQPTLLVTPDRGRLGDYEEIAREVAERTGWEVRRVAFERLQALEPLPTAPPPERDPPGRFSLKEWGRWLRADERYPCVQRGDKVLRLLNLALRHCLATEQEGIEQAAVIQLVMLARARKLNGDLLRMLESSPAASNLRSRNIHEREGF